MGIRQKIYFFRRHWISYVIVLTIWAQFFQLPSLLAKETSLKREIDTLRRVKKANFKIRSEGYLFRLLDIIDLCAKNGKNKDVEDLSLLLLNSSKEGSFTYFAAHLWLATSLLKKGKVEEAEREFEKIYIKLKDYNSKEYKQLYVWVLDSRFNAAQCHFKSPYARYIKILNELISGYKELNTVSNASLQHKLFVLQSLIEYARIEAIASEINNGSRDEISSKLTQMKINPESIFAHNVLGNIYLKKGDCDRAIQEFRKAISKEPKSLIARTGLMGAYITKGENIRALIEFKKIKRIDTFSDAVFFCPPNYHLYDIFQYYQQSKMGVQKLYFTFKVASIILPEYSDVIYAATGELYFNRGMYREAERLFKKSISLQSSSSAHRDLGYYGLGKIYLTKGLINEAIINFKRALEVAPDSILAYEWLGIIYDKHLNRRKDAIACYKKYIELGGSDDKLKERTIELEKEEVKNE